MKNLSSDNPDDCTPVCFNYDELDLLVSAVETRIDHLDGFGDDEDIAEVVDLKLILSRLEYFRDLFE